MATTIREPLSPTREPAGPPHSTDFAGENVTPAVKWWALLGGVMVAFIAFVLIRWITGPYFKSVPQGPTQLPTWMHVELVAWEIMTIPIALAIIGWFVVRPLRRNGTLSVDGVLVLGFALMWFQDPLSSGVNHWFVYNTFLLNMGSWANSVPGFAGWGTPGHMTSEPLLFTPAAYVLAMGVGCTVGTFAMRRIKGRFPKITTMGLVAGCYVSMCLFDIVLEGIIWLPLGLFEYPGGHLRIFAHTYHPYPLEEMFTIASVFTAISCLRYFVNDKGQMFIERGVDRVKGSNAKRNWLRALAGIGAMQLIMFLGYNVTNGIMAANVNTWPKQVQQLSYFTNGICGAGTDRYCPGPSTGTLRVGAPYFNTNGGITIPKGVKLPPVYPLLKQG
jgi:uncharacterized membrane protein YhdT